MRLDRGGIGCAVGDRIVVEFERDAGASDFLGRIRHIRTAQRHLILVDGGEITLQSLPCDNNGVLAGFGLHIGRCVRKLVRRAFHAIRLLRPADLILGLHLERVRLAVLQTGNLAGGHGTARFLAGTVAAPRHLVFADRAAVRRAGRPTQIYRAILRVSRDGGE